MTAAIQSHPRIYAACLAAYNNGILHGAWIDADQEEADIRAEIDLMLKRSPIPNAEEFAIHDHDGFAGVEVSEFATVARVVRLAGFISERGVLGAAVLAQFDGDLDEAERALEDGYLGCYPSLADYLQELTEETTAIPEALRYYIDWEAMARDAALSGGVFTVEIAHDEVHVFHA